MILETETNIYDPEAIAKVLKSEETKLEIQRGVISALISEEERAEYLSGQKTITSAFNSLKMTIDSTVNQISQIRDGLNSYEAKNAMYVQALDRWENSLDQVKQDTSNITTNYSSLVGTVNAITAVVGTVSGTGDNQRITNPKVYSKTEVDLSASGITSTVVSNVTGNQLVSKINQTATTVAINASKINLTGYVTAASLTSSGTTVIDGSRIETGTIMSSDGRCAWILSGSNAGQFTNTNSLSTKGMTISGGNFYFYKGTGGSGSTWTESGYVSSDSTYDYPGGTQKPGLRIGTMGGMCFITPTLGIADPRDAYGPDEDVKFYNALSENHQVVGGIELNPTPVTIDGVTGYLVTRIEGLDLSFTLGLLTDRRRKQGGDGDYVDPA